MESPFRIDVRQTPKALILDLHGDLSKQAEEGLLAFRNWEQGLEQGRTFLLLNLTGVHYINSMGIAVLIRLVRTLSRAGCQTFAYGVTPHYQKLFRMVGLTGYMMIYPDEYSVSQRIEMLAE
jgi:anti-anti-sigma factor